MARLITVLPKSIVDRIDDLNLTPYQRDNAIKIMAIIFRKQQRIGIGYNPDVAIPSAYWKKAISSHYEMALNPLIQARIIYQSHYAWLNGICASYIVNPELLEGELTVVKYQGMRKKPDRSPECRSTIKFMRNLRLDVRAAKRATDNYIDSGEFTKKITIDPDIDCDQPIECRDPSKDEPEFLTVKNWWRIADKYGMTLINDDGKYIIDFPNVYYSRKRQHLRVAYYDAIHRFQNREFIANRNHTNFRLDSNLTPFPSLLLSYLTYGKHKNPLVSIDLKNSQFTILAKLIEDGTFDEYTPDHISDHDHTSIPSSSFQYSNSIPEQHYKSKTRTTLHDEVSYNCALSGYNLDVEQHEHPVFTEDLALFVKLAKNGKIYEFLQYMLELPKGKQGREQAKQMAFEMFFSGAGMRGANKELVKIFPTVVMMTENYKKAHKDNALAILLQRTESKIFIDRIKKELDRLGLDTATKHDSVICPASQQDEVEKVVREILDQEFGEYKLSIESLSK